MVSAQTDSLPVMTSTYEIDEIEVMGRKSLTLFPEVARMVVVIQRSEIASAPVQSLQDLLEYVANIDIRQRGMNGVQADISIRGGSFDHVLVLMNGIPLSDPQTGHFNLDIPIETDAIQCIEILSGPSARVYGSGAFTGAINIVVKPGLDSNLNVTAVAGDFLYKRVGLIASLPACKVKNLLSIGHAESEGYMKNTDFSIQQLYYTGACRIHENSFDLQVGYQQKEFGANGFYSPRYPDQFEQNKTYFASLRQKSGKKITLNSSTYWRRKQDHFILRRQDPDFYQNYHINNVFGSQVNSQITTGKLTSMAGFDLHAESIISTSLGLNNIHPVKIKNEDSLYYSKQYNRSNFSFFQEHLVTAGKLSATVGYMLNWNSDYPRLLSFFPGIDISFAFSGKQKVFMSLNRSLRFPSFTDMFYTDPSNQGNQYLDPDHMVSLEGGMHFNFPFARGSFALYKAYGKNIIDWLWSYNTNRFSPVNVESIHTGGFEFSADCPTRELFGDHFPVEQISLRYGYLDVSKSLPDSVAKYYNLKHKINLVFRFTVFRNVHSSWYLSYYHRMGSFIQYEPNGSAYYATPYEPFLLVDGNLSWEQKRFTVFGQISNLLNTRYVDAGSVEQPGRWIKIGIKVNFVFDKKSKLAAM
jgi:vitamin B12 transporter